MKKSNKRGFFKGLDLRGTDAPPRTCPKCGCQVYDPFGFGKVIHDVTYKSKTVAALPNEQS
jgi:hypothetical protein